MENAFFRVFRVVLRPTVPFQGFMNNQTPFDSSNVPSASSSSATSVPTPENFAQAMITSQLLPMMGNPFAVEMRHIIIPC